MEHVLTFADDGTAGAIYDDAVQPILAALGAAQTQRASDVEPDGAGWMATMRAWVPGGAVALGPFPTRREALDAERAYLLARL